MTNKIKLYFQLTKPTIMLLVIITAATALVLEGTLISRPFDFLLVLFAIYLTGGSANALNQCFERNIDAKMTRTSKRRPLPQKKLKTAPAFMFSIFIGVAGFFILGLFFNWFSAFLSLATLLFYSLFYTLVLKPNTPQNIVIGGAAGSMAPVGAWVAASGQMALDPWILFLIIFLWTPPHFWALALVYKEDYKSAQLPMMPVVKGDDATYRQMYIYSLLMVAISFIMIINQKVGLLYLVASILLGVMFVYKTLQVRSNRTEKNIKGLFGYSILYLFGLFFVMVIDGII